jgi:hypothetical protein
MPRRPSIAAVDYSETMIKGSRLRLGRMRKRAAVGRRRRSPELSDSHFHSSQRAEWNPLFSPTTSSALAELYRVLEPGRVLAANVVLQPRGPRCSGDHRLDLSLCPSKAACWSGHTTWRRCRRLVEKTGFAIEEGSSMATPITSSPGSHTQLHD